MSSKITIDELEKYLWGSAVLLRTHVDAGAYKQYIFPLLFFKRLSDVYDEECEKVRAEFGLGRKPSVPNSRRSTLE